MNRKLLVQILPAILFFLIILFVISVYFELQLEQSESTSIVTTTTMETIANSGVLIISDYDWKINDVLHFSFSNTESFSAFFNLS